MEGSTEASRNGSLARSRFLLSARALSLSHALYLSHAISLSRARARVLSLCARTHKQTCIVI